MTLSQHITNFKIMIADIKIAYYEAKLRTAEMKRDAAQEQLDILEK